MSLAAGPVPFGFTFGASNTALLHNGDHDPSLGSMLYQIGNGTAVSKGPGNTAHIGLSDSPYPGDSDFQDLVVTVNPVPEPGSVLLMGLGLISLAFWVRQARARLGN